MTECETRLVVVSMQDGHRVFREVGRLRRPHVDDHRCDLPLWTALPRPEATW